MLMLQDTITSRVSEDKNTKEAACAMQTLPPLRRTVPAAKGSRQTHRSTFPRSAAEITADVGEIKVILTEVYIIQITVCVCVCVCVCVRERERESVCVCVCVLVVK